ncbi:hypothetical protein RRG08_045531 [Elysia crispata]|uniref:Uncharacterized protein n=1 Tax=Elysia crispata TaxID=231223 RepID=A0AAE0YE77_9GAST|nr:hypothetical protein RRG08_045531 [Elysia crispata]
MNASLTVGLSETLDSQFLAVRGIPVTRMGSPSWRMLKDVHQIIPHCPLRVRLVGVSMASCCQFWLVSTRQVCLDRQNQSGKERPSGLRQYQCFDWSEVNVQSGSPKNLRRRPLDCILGHSRCAYLPADFHKSPGLRGGLCAAPEPQLARQTGGRTPSNSAREIIQTMRRRAKVRLAPLKPWNPCPASVMRTKTVLLELMLKVRQAVQDAAVVSRSTDLLKLMLKVRQAVQDAAVVSRSTDLLELTLWRRSAGDTLYWSRRPVAVLSPSFMALLLLLGDHFLAVSLLVAKVPEGRQNQPRPPPP